MLESKGIQITAVPLFGNAYLRSLYKSKNWFLNRVKNICTVLVAYVRRLWTIVTCKKYDVVWVEKELFPYLPGIAESLLSISGVPYVVDYDDAIFHRYDMSQSKIINCLLSQKLSSLLSNAYAVTAGNPYLAEYAMCHGAARVINIPTVVDINRYNMVAEESSKAIRIGWIGSPSTARYLQIISEPLRKLAKERNIILVTIGAGTINIPGVQVEAHEWSVSSESNLLESIHIGIMPLKDSPWERGKCGYKLIQYMACGRPVIASPVGVNSDIVSTQVGFLCKTNEDWLESLFLLVDDKALRETLGAAGRLKVESEYSLQTYGDVVGDLLWEASGKRR